ncbi:hypothetical protein ACCO45_013922 [Purpureocillium lilacinum]|uniref:Uncharacterized protein n=1 Tax=Purpureocillium lilacinum TaxID=33203 RepID=A0ACC4DA81_PURLI
MLATLPASSSSSSSSSTTTTTSNNTNNPSAASAKEVRIPRDVHVQVLDVENLSASRWEQVEELEAVVRVTADDDDDNSNGVVDGTAASQTQTQTTAMAQARTANAGGGGAAPPAVAAGPNATHRLVLQDHQGNRVYAVELRRVDRIAVGKTNIGEKMVLRAGTVISRGSVLLTPETCTILGGKVEAWHEAWIQGRLARLKEAVGGDRPR